MIPELPSFVQNIINELANEVSVTSIWLVGSRANGSAKTISDWDILVFSNEDPNTTKKRHENVDVIRMGLSGTGLLEGMPIEEYKISFKNWEWREELNKQIAIYQSLKYPDSIDGVRNTTDLPYECKQQNAFCLWRR